jgi:two-component system response regulator PilR (NtrC family)
MSERILIAEDEEIVRTNVQEYLESHGYVTDGVADGQAALERALDEDYALVVTDIRMPRMDGIELLKRIVTERPETYVLIMTAYASVETAVDALRLGAYDYLLKPVVFEDLLQRVQNFFAYRALKDEVLRLRRDLTDRLGFEGIIGESPGIRKVFDLVERVAPTAATVLVVGESGTGKELVARALHARSRLAEKEFLAVNMAALPRDMVEAQLFGHEKGAFTGADRRREGILRSVRGGTVFLDELGELPLAAQSKLLRAVEGQEILPIGAERPEKAEFRLVAATNRNLEEAVQEGRFRQDLYFRLNVFRIEIPPLRERRDDIPGLVSHFARLHGRSLGRGAISVSNETMKLLLTYSWPGNVRELSNVLERACILSESDTIEVEHLPTELVSSQTLPTGLKTAVEEFERRHIAWVLRAAGGNRERAAKMLEVDPATLYRRLAKYDLQEP